MWSTNKTWHIVVRKHFIDPQFCSFKVFLHVDASIIIIQDNVYNKWYIYSFICFKIFKNLHNYLINGLKGISSLVNAKITIK